MPDLLYEIGTEELPAGYLEPALEQLADEVRSRLEELHLEPATLRTAGTPRRMTLFVEGLPESQPARAVRTIGPPAHVAYDDGEPTAAGEGFARSQGVDVDDLRVEETDKGPYVVITREEPGQPAAELLPDVLKEATAAVTFPKSMRWEKSGFTFARPIRRLVALLDEAVLPLSIAGVEAGRVTRGHPFLAPEDIELSRADFTDYMDGLREHHVLVDIDARRQAVRRQINALMRPHGSHLRDEALLEQVTNLVEWPHAVEGSFDESFLEVPDSIVTAAMKGHQRYFPVRDGDGRLLPRFVTVTNRAAEQGDLAREGNERVLLARLEDAKFYWDEDREKKLDDLVEKLKDVVFLAGLGDNRQRSERLEELSVWVANAMGGDLSAEHVRRAAHLCKADLLTGLVGEFPGLQGVVGRELALQQGEPEPVARALAEHYLPAGADDELPQSPEGCALALADKLDAIVGCFSLGLLPKGSQDPYALRRNALGILLIIQEKGLDLHLGELIDAAREVAAKHKIDCNEETADQIREFFRDRLYHAALERGFRHDYVRAVLAAGFDDVRDFWNRLDALEQCARYDWWPDLVELVDRTFRIQRDVDRVVSVDDDLLKEPLERELAGALRDDRSEIAGLFKNRDYVAAADLYCSTFAQIVHDFFEEVFVNVEDEDVRRNRKSLCAWIYRLFAERFADLYLLETAERNG